MKILKNVERNWNKLNTEQQIKVISCLVEIGLFAYLYKIIKR